MSLLTNKKFLGSTVLVVAAVAAIYFKGSLGLRSSGPAAAKIEPFQVSAMLNGALLEQQKIVARDPKYWDKINTDKELATDYANQEVQRLLFENMLRKEAAKAGKTPHAYLERVIYAGIKAPTAKELKAYVAEKKLDPRLLEPKTQIIVKARYMTDQHFAAKKKFMDKHRAAYPVQVSVSNK